MSFNISAVGVDVASTPLPGKPAAAPATEPDEPVTVSVIPPTPPAEVHAAMATATQAYDKLAAMDRLLHFTIDDQTGVLHVEVHDSCGRLLFEVPPSKALDVAAGESLE